MALLFVFWVSVFLIFYVYAGYPLFIYFLSNFGRPLLSSAEVRPYVTLLFAAYNEEDTIREKLENCLALEYPREKLQILVVNDGSEDNTASIIREFENQGIELISYTSRRGKLSALKDAIQNVKGDILFFSDADNFYPNNTITEVVKYFADPAVGGVSGGREVIGETSLGKAEGMYWRYEEFIKICESRFGSCVGVAGDLLAIRKDSYSHPPIGIINDDFYIALGVIKNGKRMIYAPEARSFHPVAKSVRGEIERRARMVAGRYQAIFSGWKDLPYNQPLVVWQIISHKFMRPIVPIAMILVFISNLLIVVSPGNHTAESSLLYLSRPYDYICFALQVLFYLFAVLGALVKPKGTLGKVIFIPTFLVSSNLAALVGLFRYITSRQSVLWNRSVRL